MQTEANYPVTTPKFSKTSTRLRDTNDNMSKVRVVVRVRPFLSQEIAARNGAPISCISTINENCVSNDDVTVYLKDPQSSRKECYQVDSFFGQDDDNVCRIFEREVRPLIPGLFRGFNATVFAYGATGSGKTYTMQGNDGFPGLMPLAMSTILTMCKETGSTVEISYYEVYLDRCYDLLELKEKEIRILDGKDGQIHLRGLSQAPVGSMSEFEEVFSCAVQRRKIAHTGLNDVSSRSHGVLVIRVSTPQRDCFGGFVTGKINLIDLAGNEDNRRTCNEGIRLQESAKINQSLFALSNVIYALNNNTRVPYRESKLTRILQDSLGGTSRALMVACLNPGEYQEAVHTVSLAARSRQITNFIASTPKTETRKTKVDMQEKLRAWLESKGKSKSLQRIQGCGSNSVQKRNLCSSVKANVNSYRAATSTKESRLPFWNLFDNEDVNDSFFENLQSAVENKRVETWAKHDETASESVTNLSTEALEEEKMAVQEPNRPNDVSPPAANTKALSPTSVRKALSPINQNLDKTLYHEEATNTALKQKTPEEFFKPSKDKFITINTPLDKFNAMSSCLKSSLVQEYIDFLNTARREELLSIKGIGQKMSEYIIELRQTRPLQRLSDLEKIGLSSKQVHNMFNRAAAGLFNGQESTTPPPPSSKSVVSLFL